MRVTNIVPSELHEEFYKERLNQINASALIEEDVLSFDVFKRQNMSQDENATKRFLEASKIIREHASMIPTYHELVKYPSFIEEILSFYDEICKLDLSGNELSKKDELTEILVWLEESFHQREKENYFKETIAHQRFDSFRLMQTVSDLPSARILEKMLENGAKELTWEKCEPKEVSFKKALNPRQECEAMIQDLLKKAIPLEDVLVVLADYENELPILRQVAKRYQIPLEIKDLHERSKVVDFFSAGIDLWLKKDLESLIQAINNDFFEGEIRFQLNEYIRLFVNDPTDFFDVFDHVFKALEEDELLDQREKEKLFYLEEVAEEKRQEITELIAELFAIKTPLDLLVFLFETCKNKKIVQDLHERNVLLKIKEDLEACYMQITDQDSLNDFKAVLQKKKKTVPVSQKGLKVVNLSVPFPARKVVYVLSLDQENFPGFSPLNGLFDESYVEGTRYPSLAERLQFHQDQVNWILNCSEELILSFCCSSYEGKSREAAYEIEEYAQQKPIFWDLIQNEENRKTEQHSLSEPTAKSLFVNADGMIHGSISSFERYFYCPYSYFLQSGLRLYDEGLIEVNAALIGTIQHAVLEELITSYGKKYAKVDSKQIFELVEKQFMTLKKLFFKSQDQLVCMEQRMVENLMTTLEFMNDMEKNTSFICEKQEYRFEMDLLKETEAPIHIRGMIDRIDRCQNALRILDYKSSDKNLSENKVLSGIQLQLLTYLVAAVRIFDGKAAGAYYFSLKNSTVEVRSGSLNGRTFEYKETEEEDLKESWIKEEGLKGWTFDEPDLLDYDGRHINHLSVKEGHVVIRGGGYDFDKVSSVIERLYGILQGKLLEGRIECRPIEGACLFCKYKTICRFKGIEQKIEPLFEEELTVLKGE